LRPFLSVLKIFHPGNNIFKKNRNLLGYPSKIKINLSLFSLLYTHWCVGRNIKFTISYFAVNSSRYLLTIGKDAVNIVPLKEDILLWN